MKAVWFKSKKYGMVPANWLGWIFSILIIGLCIVIFRDINAFSHSIGETLTTFFPPFFFTLMIGIFIASKVSEPHDWFVKKGKIWLPITWQAWVITILVISGAIYLLTTAYIYENVIEEAPNI